MRKLKIGILGGTRGVDFWNRVLRNHPLAEVSAICENHPGLKKKVAQQVAGSRISVFSDFDEFLQSGPDAVIIANFANAHAPFAVKALQNGIHVFSESIPTQTMGEAVALCEAVEKSRKLYAYGENYCFLPHMLEIKRIFDSGIMGELMHAEGNFINDCSYKWHLLTRGDPTHWRNHVPATFYCTHSVGPLLYAAGRKAKTVVGMETQRMPHTANVGARSGSGAMEIIQLDNGGMAKSIHGNFRREYNAEYRFIAENGTVETDIHSFGKIHLYMADGSIRGYRHEERSLPYLFDAYPLHSETPIEKAHLFELSDIYLINGFIQTILGNPDARKYVIDVYQALNMSCVGTLAYHSILSQSSPITIPDFRDSQQRECWRDHNWSTDPAISKEDDLLPSHHSDHTEIPCEVYEKIAKAFDDTPLTTGSH